SHLRPKASTNPALMSQLPVSQYQREIADLMQCGGSTDESSIREKFNTYSFADYKEKVIDLLGCVCAASVETQGIIEKMNTYPLQGEVAHEHNG
ncbi:MAG: hypothetical protein WAS49_03710, partial [Candidatus Dechloromonas phosphoritropha]